jgi:hypothetical protein
MYSLLLFCVSTVKDMLVMLMLPGGLADVSVIDTSHVYYKVETYNPGDENEVQTRNVVMCISFTNETQAEQTIYSLINGKPRLKRQDENPNANC